MDVVPGIACFPPKFWGSFHPCMTMTLNMGPQCLNPFPGVFTPKIMLGIGFILLLGAVRLWLK